MASLNDNDEWVGGQIFIYFYFIFKKKKLNELMKGWLYLMIMMSGSADRYFIYFYLLIYLFKNELMKGWLY